MPWIVSSWKLNPLALKQMGGLRREEVIGERYSVVVMKGFPNDKENVNKHLFSLAQVEETGASISYESHYGDRYYITMQHPLGQGLVASMSLDITSRKKAEIELKESEAKYRDLFDNMAEGFVMGRAIYGEDGEPTDIDLHDGEQPLRRPNWVWTFEGS